MKRNATVTNSDTLAPPAMVRKVRVGILIDSPEMQVWSFEMLERIQSSNFAEVVQVVENSASGSRRKSGLTRFRHIWRRLGYSLFSRIDTKLSRLRNDPCATKSILPLLGDVNWIKAEPIRSGFIDRFRGEDIESMAKDNADVYIRLGFGILKGDVLSLSRLGVWSYHHGDNLVNRGLPPGFWEVNGNESVTGITLQVLTEELDAGRCLYRSFSKTNSVYVHQSISCLYWKSVAIIPRVLKKLHRLGIEEFEADISNANTETVYYTRPLYRYPTNWQAFRHLLLTVHRLMCHKAVKLMCSEQWMLMYRLGAVESSRTSLWRYKEIRPPADRFWADPFVITVDGLHHVFFEQLVYAENKGTIAHLSITKDGEVSPVLNVMEKPYHLSYPFIFEHCDSIYMIPESSENRTVDLYKCEELPGKWSHVRTLIEGQELVDATVIFHDGLWWMFAGQRDDERVSISEELSIFYTHDILNGAWTPHPCNPVVSDIRCARPAGRILRKNGVLYRPAQDCCATYGGAIEIRRIDILTTKSYQESFASRLDPDWRNDLSGVHTLDEADEVTVIDVVSRRLKFANLTRSERRE